MYEDLSSKRLLVMERLKGVALTDLEGIKDYSSNPEATLITALNTWSMSVMMAESFHAVRSIVLLVLLVLFFTVVEVVVVVEILAVVAMVVAAVMVVLELVLLMVVVVVVVVMVPVEVVGCVVGIRELRQVVEREKERGHPQAARRLEWLHVPIPATL